MAPLMADLLGFNNPLEVKPEIKMEPEAQEPEREIEVKLELLRPEVGDEDDQETIHVCNMCYKCFTHQSQLEDHKLLEHRGKCQNPYMCGKCSEPFSTGDKLRDHCFVFSSDCSLEDRYFVCPSCYMTFRDLDLYMTHCSKHNVNRMHQCDLCDKSFTRVALLNEHKRTHNKDHPFQCKECGKVFCRKSVLMKHGRVHRGERPYQCKICAKTFTEGSSLQSRFQWSFRYMFVTNGRYKGQGNFINTLSPEC